MVGLYCPGTTCHVDPQITPWGGGGTGRPLPICTCANLSIYIPPGEHVHWPCPRHGDVVLRGSSVTC